MSGIDVAIIILYFIIILGIGVYFSNKDKDNTDQYFLANEHIVLQISDEIR